MAYALVLAFKCIMSHQLLAIYALVWRHIAVYSSIVLDHLRQGSSDNIKGSPSLLRASSYVASLSNFSGICVIRGRDMNSSA